MDIGLREWLIIIGIIVIAGILFDGWRRMSGKGKLKFRLDNSLSGQSDEGGSSELLGPSRVIDPREPSFDDDEKEAPRSNGRSRKRREEPVAEEVMVGDPEPELSALDVEDDLPTRGRGKNRKEMREKAAEPAVSEAAPKERKELPPVEEVLVINVISRDESGFRGPALLQNILESGLRFGDMDIFHRHESMSGNGEVLFSMANAVRPGTFDLDAIDDFRTPAVSFFLGLPGPRHPKQAFEVMVAAARKLASELNGELKDEQRSVMTAQTIEHYRQRIIDFERKSLTQKR
ncbi:cell division protein ZipA [Pseudomonas duriflava]|uniref:Cell division protein ZipA n=1 Tax=Pseudomonas duriflava TaxID=459528 RepID=A0A562PQ81_9PSED|nr:cell division protein ZipA [Pseudomonas duriflava]TWI46340.1 cell division protein ZipA [Pseudomonas duriflava]